MSANHRNCSDDPYNPRCLNTCECSSKLTICSTCKSPVAYCCDCSEKLRGPIGFQGIRGNKGEKGIKEILDVLGIKGKREIEDLRENKEFAGKRDVVEIKEILDALDHEVLKEKEVIKGIKGMLDA